MRLIILMSSLIFLSCGSEPVEPEVPEIPEMTCHQCVAGCGVDLSCVAECATTVCDNGDST